MNPDINNNDSGNFLLSLVLWVISGACYGLSYAVKLLIMPEFFTELFSWLLNLASLASLILVIAVNWKRGVAQIKEWLK